MCLICVSVQKDLLTTKEIARNFREMQVNPEDPDHWVEILKELTKKNLVEEVAKELTALGHHE